MATSRKCKDCKCSCLLVSVGCIKGLLNPFIATTEDKKLRAAIDEATVRYIIPVIGTTCFDALCSALDLSDLPSNDEAYVALPDHYNTLVEIYAKTIISEAATALYIDTYGYDRLSVDYSEQPDLHADYRKARYAGAAAQKNALKTWLEDPDVAALFTCLPTTEDEECNYETTVGMSSDFGDFAASTRYPGPLRPTPDVDDLRRLENP